MPSSSRVRMVGGPLQGITTLKDETVVGKEIESTDPGPSSYERRVVGPET